MRRPVLLCAILSGNAIAHGSVIDLPADQATIQDAIDAAENGDVIRVAPGAYFENLNFNGKAITVKSSNGNKVTIIDGGHANSVVTFDSPAMAISLPIRFSQALRTSARRQARRPLMPATTPRPTFCYSTSPASRVLSGAKSTWEPTSTTRRS